MAPGDFSGNNSQFPLVRKAKHFFSIIIKATDSQSKGVRVNLCCLTPLSTIFQLYHGCQFYII
jgi:hypothetical protein